MQKEALALDLDPSLRIDGECHVEAVEEPLAESANVAVD